MDPLPKPAPSLLDPQLLWATLGLVATLLLGALVFAWIDRWRKRPDRSAVTPADQLAAFRLSYERGELSQEEYERIRATLAPRIKEQLDLPPRDVRNAERGMRTDEPKPRAEAPDGERPASPPQAGEV
jgi:hypothetical protein